MVKLHLAVVFLSINRELSFTPHVRYGFSNGHLNGWGTLDYHKRSNWRGINNTMSDDAASFRENNFSLSGGRRISQFNKDNPISPLFNSIYTLFFNHNYMKIYENNFVQFNYNGASQSGLKYTAQLLYEDRHAT